MMYTANQRASASPLLCFMSYWLEQKGKEEKHSSKRVFNGNKTHWPRGLSVRKLLLHAWVLYHWHQREAEMSGVKVLSSCPSWKKGRFIQIIAKLIMNIKSFKVSHREIKVLINSLLHWGRLESHPQWYMKLVWWRKLEENCFYF